VALAAAALTLGACGDDGVQPAPGIEGAEQTVRDYLTALSEGDGDSACGYFSDEYEQGIIDQNQDVADQLGASDCTSFIEAVRDAGSLTIGGEDLTPELAEQINLETDLSADLTDSENESATVHAAEQTYELEVIDGTWEITGSS